MIIKKNNDNIHNTNSCAWCGKQMLHAATHGSTSCSYHIISLFKKKKQKKEEKKTNKTHTIFLVIVNTKLKQKEKRIKNLKKKKEKNMNYISGNFFLHVWKLVVPKE